MGMILTNGARRHAVATALIVSALLAVAVVLHSDSAAAMVPVDMGGDNSPEGCLLLADKGWFLSGCYQPGMNAGTMLGTTDAGQTLKDTNSLTSMRMAPAALVMLMVLLVMGPVLMCGLCHSPHVCVYKDTGDKVYPRVIAGVCEDCGTMIDMTVPEPPTKHIAS
jgi:hypothetical protein